MDPAKREHVSDLHPVDLTEVVLPPPIVNMVEISEVGGARLSPIQEQSAGSTHTWTETYDEYSHDTDQQQDSYDSIPEFPPGFGGIVFNISADERTIDGKTEQERDARLARNTNRAERRNAPPNPKSQTLICGL